MLLLPTILDKINGTSGPPLHPISVVPKWRVFAPSCLHHCFGGGGGGLLVIFILSKFIELTSHWSDLLCNGNTITNAITCDKCHNLREISSVESDDCARWQKTNTSCHLRLKVIPKMCKKLRRFGNSHYQPLSPPSKNRGAKISCVFYHVRPLYDPPVRQPTNAELEQK